MKFAKNKDDLIINAISGAVLSRLLTNNKEKRLFQLAVGLAISLFGLFSLGIASASDQLDIPVALLGIEERKHIPLSLLRPVIDDSAQLGAEQGISDNNTTGQFTGQSFRLMAQRVKPNESLSQAFLALYNKGVRLFLLNLPRDKLLKIADLPEAGDSLLFNIAAKDDRLSYGPRDSLR